MFLSRRFYLCSILVIVLLGMGYFFQLSFVVGKVVMFLLVIATVADAVLLYTVAKIQAQRVCAGRFSNGDENPVTIKVNNFSPLTLRLTIIDELPFVFQKRDMKETLKVQKRQSGECTYFLRPVTRGDYSFGKIRVFASTRVGLVNKRFTCGENTIVKVYPSFSLLKSLQILSKQNLSEIGMKRIRHVGNNTDFEHIKDYVKGDDYRTINWKASARRHQLMVNVYQEERSQQIFSVVDMGRTMQYVFNGMTLLDYAINASLMLSYVAVTRQDNAGLITFADKLYSFLPASRQPAQMRHIMENLYNLKTSFLESDYSLLCHKTSELIGRRSFLMLYTSFSGIDALKRQLPYLRELNRRHRLLVIFFEDSEMNDYAQSKPSSNLEYYQHIVAEKFIYEKRLIVNKLIQNGILSLLTTPERLSVDVVNKYLEIKSRNLLV